MTAQPTIIGGGQVPVLGPGSGTNFLQIGMTGWNGLLYSSSEAEVQTKHRAAETLSRLGCRLVTNTHTNTGTLKLRVNGADVNQSVSLTASTTGFFEDATHSDTIADGDLVNVSLGLTGGGGGGVTLGTIVCKVAGPSNTTVQYFSFSGHTDDLTQTTASQTAYANLGGGNTNTSPSTAESDTVSKMRTAGTFSHLQCNINTNSWASAFTFRIRKNTGNGSSSLSVTGATTGLFEDVTNSDSVVSGDVCNYSYTAPAGSGSLKISQIAVKYVSSSTDFELMSGWNGSGMHTQFSTSVPSYLNLIGVCGDISGTEADWKTKVPFGAVMKKFIADLSGNNSGTDVTATVRQNGSDTTLTVSITNHTTGRFEDTTHTSTLSDGDDIDVKFTNPNSTTFVLRQLGVVLDSNVGGGGAGVSTYVGAGLIIGS